MPKGIYKRPGRRGKQKSYATPRGPVYAPKKAAAAIQKQTRVSAKNVVSTRFDELMPLVQELVDSQKLIVRTLQTLFEIQKANFLDSFRLSSGAAPEAFLSAFKNTARLLGLTEAFLAQAKGEEVPVCASMGIKEPSVPGETSPSSGPVDANQDGDTALEPQLSLL